MPVNVDLCTGLEQASNAPCVRLPAGAELCFPLPGVTPPTLFELGVAALNGVNTALAPLSPVFDVIETVQALGDTIKAVATLNPEKIAEAIPILIEKIAALAGLVPQLSVPLFIVDTIGVLGLAIEGLARELETIADYIGAIDAVADLSDRYAGVASATECARDHCFVMLTHLGNQVAPLNRLIGLLNGFLELAGLPETVRIPCLVAFTPDKLTPAIQVLRKLGEILRVLGGQIQIPGAPKSRVVAC